MEYGGKILPAYYESHINRWNKKVSLVKNIRSVYVPDRHLNGTLSKLEFNGKVVNVADYKTGSSDYAIKKQAPPNANMPEWGDYWRQAVSSRT